jgi:hypothetical protein
VDTLGYATSGTFPSGGASVQTAGGGGPPGGFGAGAGGRRPGAGGLGGVPLFGSGGAPAGAPPGIPGGSGRPPLGGTQGAIAGPGASGGPGAARGAFGSDGSITKVLSYVKQHGGGTIAVSSQSSAAQAIIDQNADVAGIGGFSGRESDVSVSWLAQEVRTGNIRWVLVEQTGAPGGGARLAGDTRAGSEAAMAAVASACRKVTLPATSTGATGTTGTIGATGTGRASSASTLYDCQSRGGVLSAGARESAL